MMLSGGEALLDPLRAEVTYMVVERLTAKYARHGGVKIWCRRRGISSTSASLPIRSSAVSFLISVAGVDVRQRLIAVGAASASVFHVMSTSLFSYCLKFDAGLRAGRVTGCEVVVRPVCGCSAGRLRRDRTTESRTDHAALQSLSPRY